MEIPNPVLDGQPRDAQADLRSAQSTHGVLQAGDSLPARCYQADMCRAFGISRRSFYTLLKQRKFDRFEILPRIGRRAWSGAKVTAYLNGQR